MKFIAVVLVALAVSAQADESEHNTYQTHYDHYHEHHVDPYTGYDSDLTSAYNYVSEKQDFDMDTILPIVVFGGLGLGALAYVDSLNRMNNICNKLRSVTDAARGTATDGATAATGGTAATDRIINSNREFINTLIAIDSLDC